MGLEAATYLSDLVGTNPVTSDVVAQGDDHIRLLKNVLKTTFPNATRAFNFPAMTAISADTSMALGDDNETLLVDATAAARTITLPTLLAANAGWRMEIAKIDSSVNIVTIAPPSGTINGAANLKLRYQYERIEVQWTGTEYQVHYSEAPLYRYVAKTADATLDDSEMRSIVLVNSSVDPVTITLPAAKDGDWVIIRRVHATRNVVVDANGAELIDGATTFSFNAQNETVLLIGRTGAWIVASHYSGTASAAPQYRPQGYLTLSIVDGSPYPTSDEDGLTSIFYDFLDGDQIPITTDGITFRMRKFTRTEIILTSDHAANTLYDIGAWDDAGTLRFGTTPAWSNSSVGASTRGSGAGSNAITRLNGLIVNNNSLTMRNGGTTYSVAANRVTIVGTVLIDPTAGEVSHHTAIGQSRRCSIGNLYNKRKTSLKVTDPTSTWTLNGATFRPSRNDQNNSLDFVTCLPGQEVEADFFQTLGSTGVNSGTQIGIGVNSIVAPSGFNGLQNYANGGGPSQGNLQVSARFRGPLPAGRNKLTCLEVSNVSQSITFRGGEQDMYLSASFEA